MKPRHLLAPEIDYELKIRNVVTDRDIKDKHKILGKLLQKERESGKTQLLVDPDYSFINEQNAINITLDSIKNNVSDFEGTTKDSLYIRTKSRLSHVQGRIERMQIDRTILEQVTFKNEALATSITLEADLDGSIKTDNPTPQVIDLSSTFGYNNQPNTSSPYAFPNKTVPIYKWDLKFDGSNSGLGVKAFLERVEELSEARHVTKKMLYESAVDLFTGKALLWFRHLKESGIVSDWDSLVSKLEIDFLDLDYEEELWNSIKNRKQLSDESVVIFVAIMESLYNRLSNKPAVVTRIKWIKRNLRVEISGKLALKEYSTVNELVQDAKILESFLKEESKSVPAVKCNVLHSEIDGELSSPSTSFTRPQINFKNQNKNKFQYSNKRNTFYNHRNKPQRYPSNEVQSLRTSKSVICWNCNGPNHTFQACTLKRNKFCYKCGNPGVVLKDCVKCSENK